MFDPSQAILLAQQLRKRGLRMDEFTFHARAVSQLALSLHGLIRSHSLVLPNDAELLDELANVRLRETSPGTYRLDHDPDRHDDRAIALALAAHHLVERASHRSGGGVTGAIVGRSRLDEARERNRRVEEPDERRQRIANTVEAEKERARRKPDSCYDPRFG